MAIQSPLEQVNNESSSYTGGRNVSPLAQEQPVTQDVMQDEAEDELPSAQASPPAVAQLTDPIAAQMEKFRAGRQALDAQITKMKAALAERQKLPFDPVMLAVAQAAATPSSTGSGIQGLGRIAGAYGDAYSKERLRQEANAKEQLALSEKQYDLLKQEAGQEALYKFASGQGQQGVPPQGGTNVAALTTQSTTIPPVADTPPAGGMRRITDQDIIQLAVANPEAAEMLRQTAKMQRDALVVTAEGVFNTITGKFEVNFEMPIKRPVRVLGEVDMTKGQSKQYDTLMNRLMQSGATDEQLDQAAASFAAQNGIGGVRKKPDGTFSGFASPREKANIAEQDKATIANRAEENKAARTSIYGAGQRAQTVVQQSKILYNLSTDPTTRNAFGVLNKPGVLNAFAQAVSQGVQAGGSTIAFPGLETAVRNAGGTQQEINAAIIAAQAQSVLQLMAAQDYLKGQGAVSDAERRLISNLAGSLSDTPQTMAMKAKVIEARANYDKMVSDAFYKYEETNPNATVQEFYRKSPEFKNLFEAYDSHMEKLYGHYFGSKSSTKPAAPSTNQAPSKAPANAPNQNRTPGPLEQRIIDGRKKN
jgi:hypothetical protein